MKSIDLNADLGEGEPNDADLMPLISSCNIACGGHVGDAQSMRRTIDLALEHAVAMGAHPSYPDREGFGRRPSVTRGDTLRKSLAEQCTALNAVATSRDVTLRHVKPHGALYNEAAIDPALAQDVVAAVVASLGVVAVVGPPDSALQSAAQAAKLPFLAEGFVDRCYRADGSLVPRAEPGAVHSRIEVMTTQALQLSRGAAIRCQDGSDLSLNVDTLCIHGDTDNALQVASAVRDVLTASQILVKAASID